MEAGEYEKLVLFFHSGKMATAPCLIKRRIFSQEYDKPDGGFWE
jgi:hypothetical protein